MTHRATVVRKRSKIEKPRLHALLMEGWGRAITRFGKGAWADALSITGPGLDKQLTGSMPDFETIMDALDHDETILDDVLREKGLRLVAVDAVCDADDLGLLLARLNLKLEEARHPDSPGGCAVVHTEILAMEGLLRETHRITGAWLERIAQIRRPRVA